MTRSQTLRWGLLASALTLGAIGIAIVVQDRTDGPDVGQELIVSVDPSEDCGRFDLKVDGWRLTNLSPLPNNERTRGIVVITEKRDSWAGGVFRTDDGSEVDVGGGPPGKTFDSLVCFIG